MESPFKGDILKWEVGLLICLQNWGNANRGVYPFFILRIYKFYPPRISKLLIARGQLWKGHYRRYLKKRYDEKWMKHTLG
ncbi:hypothetical protein L2E82_32926 [Cichorium intybus]|uniref:Uncharacterized protein n=1 Tax=Cichorium intybus TaxID=13427 RepID=A0ACB9BHP8_CICIN|nr:hypothetical protein L2E82_32926 [Cichorium intybus]